VTTLTLHATGSATPAEAWERYASFARWPEWSPQITGVDVAADRIGPGITGRVRGPLGVPLPFLVDEVDEATRQWSWSVFAGPVRLQLRHWVSPGPDGGSTTGLRVRGAAPLVAGYAPLALVALKGLVSA
jgi:polyketide cyclase/dehydrase/lipid transport protein